MMGLQQLTFTNTSKRRTVSLIHNKLYGFITVNKQGVGYMYKHAFNGMKRQIENQKYRIIDNHLKSNMNVFHI